MQVRYVTVDVFTDRVFGGNPLAVILDAEGLRVVGERFDEGHNHYFFTLKA